MTYVGLHGMSDDPQILLRRLSAFAERQGTTKDFARAAGCDIRTAENMRRGVSWPNARHFLQLWKAFGDDFIEALVYPERATQRLEKEVADLERKLQQKQAELARAEDRSIAPHAQKAPPGNENRAAELSGRRVA